MREEALFELLGEVDPQRVAAAVPALPTRKPLRFIRFRRGALAACFAAALLAAFSLLFSPHPQGVTSPEGPGGSAAGDPAGQTHIRLAELHFNEIGELLGADAARILYDSELYDTDVAWGKTEVAAYYGRDLTPAYIPAGLTAAPGNGTARVILDKKGTVVEDTVSLSFYHDYFADGSPKLTEDVPKVKGFTVSVSKVGLLDCCLYLLPENEVKTSRIGETEVTFGYRSMPHGPYDPDTHAPSGYYDLYVARFTFGGAEYRIVAEQLEAQEVVKVVASILCAGEVTVTP